MFTAAKKNCPSRSSSKLSNAKVEKVVKPPSTPISRNARVSGRKQKPFVRETGDRAEYGAPEHVDSKRAERKQWRYDAVNERRQEIARHRTEGTANGDEQDSHV